MDKMDKHTAGLINGPITILNVLTNIFFGFCIMFPPPGERIKQPLKFLLLSIVCGILTYQMFSMIAYFSNESWELSFFLSSTYMYSMFTTMSSCAWIAFYYFTQIVPAQRALFVWIKKNIKAIIYSICFLERVLTLIYYICLFDVTLILFHPASYNFSDHSNSTDFDQVHTLEDLPDTTRTMFLVLIIMQEVQFFSCLFVMMMSNGSTVLYLCRHMCHMRANGLPFQHFSSHMRVTLIGFLHGVLYMIWCLWTSNQYYNVSVLHFMTYTSCTINNVYLAGTTVSLGFSQLVFRQRAAAIWVAVAGWFKAWKTKQTEEEGGLKLTPVR